MMLVILKPIHQKLAGLLFQVQYENVPDKEVFILSVSL